MQAAGISIDEMPIADSVLHRFKVKGDKNGSNNGWYVLYGDNNPKGCFGSWKLGINETWSLKQFTKYTSHEREEWKQQQAKAQQERKKAKEFEHKEARSEALRIWDNAQPENGGHKYLRSKGVKPYGIRTNGHQLIIPLRDTRGIINSLQYINPNGDKKFLTGGEVKDHYHAIGVPENTLVIVEGYSTGASVHEATGFAVGVAFNAGNLQTIAKILRDKIPDITLIIAGDDDQLTEGNPGKRNATEAAVAVHAKLIIPTFKNTESKLTDFNDLHQSEGLEVVKQQIETAAYVEQSIEEKITASIDVEVKKLATLSHIEYDLVRIDKADELNIRVGTLDKEVEAARKKLIPDDMQTFAGREVKKEELEPWGEPVNSQELYNELKTIIKQRVILPEHTEVAAALWIVLTYCFNKFDILPMLLISSPVKRCGKTTCRKVIEKLVYNPLSVTSISEAAIYRTIEMIEPCLIIDEVDRLLRSNQNQTLIGLINGAHDREGAEKIINVPKGDDYVPSKFSTYGPKLLSGIGKLEETMADRGIPIQLRRKYKTEKIIRTTFKTSFKDTKRKILRFVNDHREQIEAMANDDDDKDLFPDEINDRDVNNWFPLLTLAKVFGCFDEAKQAAIVLSQPDAGQGENTKITILEDIYDYFQERNAEYFWTKDMLLWLSALEERPYSEWNRGKGMTARNLGKIISDFGAKSKPIRIGGSVSKGFYRKDLEECFLAYTPGKLVTPVTPVTSKVEPTTVVTDVTHVTENTESLEGEHLNGNPTNNDGFSNQLDKDNLSTAQPSDDNPIEQVEV